MPDAITNESDVFEIGGDVPVHRLGFGAMRLCGQDIVGSPDDEAAARRVVRRAIEVGVDLIDTADSYGPGVSERLLGQALDDEDDVVVATKAGLLRNRDGDWLPHGDPDYLRNQVLCSRDRLGVDTIDLYQYHRPDPDTDFAAAVETFAEMQDEGEIRHVGLSNVTVDELETAMDIVDVATVQNQYNVGNREDEAVLEACESYDVGFIPWGPLYAVDDEDAAPVLEDVAAAHDATASQVALAWLLEHSDVTLPIPGTSSVEHLEENVGASQLSLSADAMARLNDVDPVA